MYRLNACSGASRIPPLQKPVSPRRSSAFGQLPSFHVHGHAPQAVALVRSRARHPGGGHRHHLGANHPVASDVDLATEIATEANVFVSLHLAKMRCQKEGWALEPPTEERPGPTLCRLKSLQWFGWRMGRGNTWGRGGCEVSRGPVKALAPVT